VHEFGFNEMVLCFLSVSHLCDEAKIGFRASAK